MISSIQVFHGLKRYQNDTQVFVPRASEWSQTLVWSIHWDDNVPRKQSYVAAVFCDSKRKLEVRMEVRWIEGRGHGLVISWLRFKWRKYYRRYYLHTGGRAEKLRSAPDRLHVLKLHLVELTEQVIYLLKGDMRSRAGRSGRRGGITQDPARSDSVKGGTRSEEKRGEVRSQEQCNLLNYDRHQTQIIPQ